MVWGDKYGLTIINEIEKMEKNTLEYWHNQTLNYNLEKYNFPKWALGVINEIFPQVRELESIHKILSADTLNALSIFTAPFRAAS